MFIKYLSIFAFLAASVTQARETDLEQKLSNFVESKNIPGMVVMVEHKNEILFHEAVGYSSIEDKIPMQLDDRFRWFSMSKPVTALAMLKTLDTKELGTQADIKQLYPGFDKSTPISFQQLLTHTAGFGYGGEPDSLTGWMYWLLDPLEKAESLGEMMSKLDGIPLHNTPGDAFKYSMSSDVQGAIIQHANGYRLDNYMAEKIFAPLDMHSAGFVKKGQPALDIVPFYRFDKRLEKSVMVDDPTEWDKPVFAGGSGMTGTAEDYMKFLRVLRSPEDYAEHFPSELVAQMTKNQLPAGIAAIPDQIYSNTGYGYGLGVSLKDGVYLPRGSIYWAGLAGSIFWFDPVNNLAVVIMIQELGARKAIEKHLTPMIYEWFRTHDQNTHR